MSITIPKPLIPILKKPMTPPWVLALALVVQFASSQFGNSPIPSCTLVFECPHHSTSIAESRGVDAIKLNVKSVCNVPQRFTELSASMQTIKNEKRVDFFHSSPRRISSTTKKPNEAEFLNFWEPCIKGKTVTIWGEAHGVVYLQNGNEVQVSSNTGKFTPVFCGIKAK